MAIKRFDQELLTKIVKQNDTRYAKKEDVESIQSQVEGIEVPSKVSDLENDSEFQSLTEVAASIQAAIAETGHASFTKVDEVPSADDAEENVLYLVMNEETEHYDIYALVSGEVVWIDDTTTDLSQYVTTEAMEAAIANFLTEDDFEEMTDDEISAAFAAADEA